MSKNTVYIFVGEGLGVPGLPHRITEAEAEARGAGELLRAAILNGNYIAEGAEPEREPDTPAAGAINLADGADEAEASLAGKTLARRKKGL